ncbi:MAG: hypothetical protein ACK5MT_07680 [Actinomycetales bacterium]
MDMHSGAQSVEQVLDSPTDGAGMHVRLQVCLLASGWDLIRRGLCTGCRTLGGWRGASLPGRALTASVTGGGIRPGSSVVPEPVFQERS